MSRQIWLLSFLVLFTGCTSGTVVEDIALPLARIKKIVARHLPGGIRKRSTNGREYFSYHFSPSKSRGFDPEKSTYRSYLHVKILGDRRPYTIEVLAIIEKKERGGGRYERMAYDERISRRYAQKIKKTLDQSSEDVNFVDEFRAF